MDLGPATRANPATRQLARFRAMQGGGAPEPTQAPAREWDQSLMDSIHANHQPPAPRAGAPDDAEMARRREAHRAARHQLLATRNKMVNNVRTGQAADAGIAHPEGTSVQDVWRGLPAPHAPAAALAQPIASAAGQASGMMANFLPGVAPVAAAVRVIGNSGLPGTVGSMLGVGNQAQQQLLAHVLGGMFRR